jgi:hypothetical protein
MYDEDDEIDDVMLAMLMPIGPSSSSGNGQRASFATKCVGMLVSEAQRLDRGIVPQILAIPRTVHNGVRKASLECEPAHDREGKGAVAEREARALWGRLRLAEER